jgi:predicted site-specific integrase-resolvase
MYSIRQFSQKVGLSVPTIYAYIYKGFVKPCKTKGGHYRFDDSMVDELLGTSKAEESKIRKTVIYARVSTPQQTNYLDNQIEACKQFACSKGIIVDIILKDIASSFNFKRDGLNKLLSLIEDREISTLIVYSKDRLTRMAFDLLHQVCLLNSVDIIVIDNSEVISNQQHRKDLFDELVSFIHYITSKIYGARRYKKQLTEQFIESLQKENIAGKQNE